MDIIEKLIGELKESKIDVVKHQIMGRELTQIQFGLILLLIMAGEQGCSREELVEGMGLGYVTDRTIDVHVLRIREKFTTSYRDHYPINCIRGEGYRIDPRFLKRIEK